MEIKVLGSGCPNCRRLEDHVKRALTKMDQEASIEKVTDYNDIASFGVMSTPALVVDGTVVVSGRVPSPRQLVKILENR